MQIGKAGKAESRICVATADRVEVHGRDLTGDLMAGKAEEAVAYRPAESRDAS